MKLVFLYGAPGVGKLTVGRELSQLTGYGLFHNHLTVDLLASAFPFHSQAFAELREQIWLDVFRRASQERLPGLIFTFVFEPTVLPGFFERVQATLAPDDRLYPIQLRCEPWEHVHRITAPDRAAFLKMRDAESASAALLRGEYDPPHELPGNLDIDTTLMSPLETARLVRHHIGA